MLIWQKVLSELQQ